MARLFAPGVEAPTAVLASSDGLAVYFIDALERRGLRVPHDVSVCAVAGAAASAQTTGLACCRFDFAEMGRKGAELLRERCESAAKPVNRIHRIGCEWVEGASVGRVSGD